MKSMFPTNRLTKRSVTVMNLTHVISEFSFGPFIPDISQPLDYSFEVTHERRLFLPGPSALRNLTFASIDFTAFQYFVTVVPTTYQIPGQDPLHTNQYSVTHYTRTIEHGRGTPGIFFKVGLQGRFHSIMLILLAIVRYRSSRHCNLAKDHDFQGIPRSRYWRNRWCLGVRWMGCQSGRQGRHGRGG